MGDIESNSAHPDKRERDTRRIFRSSLISMGEAMDQTISKEDLETIDAVARAAHLWVRTHSLDSIPDAGERRALASGLVEGLCSRLNLGSRLTEFVAYVYAILDNEGDLALPVARYMLDQPIAAANRVAFARGRAAAAEIIELVLNCPQSKIVNLKEK
jgi:hypothetical protein